MLRLFKSDSQNDNHTLIPISKSKSDLPLPVYLDYQTVFDLLAILDEGLSQFHEIKTVYSDERSNDRSAGANLSTKVPLGFLSMEAGAGLGSKQNAKNSSSHEITGKKVHTSVSLFGRMRDLLYEGDFVEDSFDFTKLETGKFVEFQAKFKKLEVIKVLETLTRAIELGDKFTGGNNNKHKTKIPKEIAAMQETLEPVSKTNLLYEISKSKRIILELSPEYLVTDSLDKLMRGEYKVFGKVTRVEKNGFNIFESTALGLFKPEALGELLSSAFSDVVSSDGDIQKMFDVPENVPMQYGGSVAIIKPIAIFV